MHDSLWSDVAVAASGHLAIPGGWRAGMRNPTYFAVSMCLAN